MTGNRRFWPIHVKDIDLAGVAKVVDQLWAEAVTAWLARPTLPAMMIVIIANMLITIIIDEVRVPHRKQPFGDLLHVGHHPRLD
nr:VapE domain-containing protein [Mesorhizobium sp. WSM2561]